MRAVCWLASWVGLAMAGCGGPAFSCSDDTSCDAGAQGGRCEPTGFCSFPDPGCTSGYRYGEHAGGGLASVCVDPPGTGDGSTGPNVDTSGADSTPDPDGDDTTSTGASAATVNGTTGAPPSCYDDDWWDCAWRYRREIVVSGDPVAETLSGFPVPVVVDDVSDPARFGSDGLDIRIVDEMGELLPFEVDTWQPDAPALVWVRIPSLEAGAGARAFLYYGNPRAPALDIGVDTWDDDFVGVWHMRDASDATAYANHAEDQGSQAAAGIFAGARAFSAEDERLLVAPSRSLADLSVGGLTISALIAPASPGLVSGGRVFDNADHTAATEGVSLLLSPTTLGVEFNQGAATSESKWIATRGVSYGSWQHLALTFVDGGTPQAFLDAQPIAWTTGTPPVGALGSDVSNAIGLGGAPYDATHTFDGAIDELRVSRVQRSAAWLQAEHAAAVGELVTLGPEEDAP